MSAQTKLTIDDAKRLVGAQPRTALRNMVKALSLHPWNNTAEERQRLEAAKIVLKTRKRP